MFANGARSADAEHAAELAVTAEELGYESLWAVQHVVMPAAHVSRYPYSDGGTVPGGSTIAIPDPLVWLAWAGALTSRIRLATGVLVLPQRLQEEFDALGADFQERGSRTDEAIEVLRRAWSPGPTVFEGHMFHFPAVHVEPKRARSIPIVIGGHSDAAARRAGRLGDGFFPLACQGERLARLVDTVRAAAREAGRDPERIEITVDAPTNAAEAETQADLGVDRVVFNAPHAPVNALRDALGRRLHDVTELLGNA